jgi:hypothetical protein
MGQAIEGDQVRGIADPSRSSRHQCDRPSGEEPPGAGKEPADHRVGDETHEVAQRQAPQDEMECSE